MLAQLVAASRLLAHLEARGARCSWLDDSVLPLGGALAVFPASGQSRSRLQEAGTFGICRFVCVCVGALKIETTTEAYIAWGLTRFAKRQERTGAPSAAATDELSETRRSNALCLPTSEAMLCACQAFPQVWGQPDC